MKHLKQFSAALALTLAAGVATAQTYHIRETFYEGDVFDGLVTFSNGFDAISAVKGTLVNYQTDPAIKHVTGIESLSYSEPAPGVKSVFLTGPDGFPGGYLITLAWDKGHAPVLSLPVFVTDSYQDPMTGQMVYFYSNSINGLNYATSVSITAVPEPATYGMLALGLGVLGLSRRRKTK